MKLESAVKEVHASLLPLESLQNELVTPTTTDYLPLIMRVKGLLRLQCFIIHSCPSIIYNGIPVSLRRQNGEKKNCGRNVSFKSYPLWDAVVYTVVLICGLGLVSKGCGVECYVEFYSHNA
jgi:hypothetical protein